MEIGCALSNDDSGFTCNGCGEYSTGEACYDFGCAGPDENGVEECTCNSVKWNGEECGECSIDSDGNPQYNCAPIGGPDNTVAFPAQVSPDDIEVEAVDNRFPYPVCESIDGEEECAEISCSIIDSGLAFECKDCVSYTSGEACVDFECDAPDINAPDQVGCRCNGITWDGIDCGECTINYGSKPHFDCSSVRGPTSPAAGPGHFSVRGTVTFLSMVAFANSFVHLI